jgi:Presenilin enhancer-2 subunit of gamma secretase
MNFIPVGHEIENSERRAREKRAHQPPSAPSAAPWERAGASLSPPGGAEAQAAAARWTARAAADTRAAEAERAARREARRARREAAKVAAAVKLAATARRLFFVGFAALPFVWLVNVIYFWGELKNGKGAVAGDGVFGSSGDTTEETVDEEQRSRDEAIRKRMLRVCEERACDCDA